MHHPWLATGPPVIHPPSEMRRPASPSIRTPGPLLSARGTLCRPVYSLPACSAALNHCPNVSVILTGRGQRERC
jgi:hypothetical protein